MSHVLDGPDAPSGAAPLPDGSAVETPPAAGPAPPVGASARARKPALNSVPHGGGRRVRPGAQDTPLS